MSIYTQIVITKSIISTIYPYGWDCILDDCESAEGLFKRVMYTAKLQNVHPAVVRKVFNLTCFEMCVEIGGRCRIRMVYLPSTKEVMERLKEKGIKSEFRIPDQCDRFEDEVWEEKF